MRLKTVEQLRTGTPPNNWEVAWVFWGYQRPEQSYYFVAGGLGQVDPNGAECDWPEYENCLYDGAQRYLATGATPSFPIGERHRVRITQAGGAISVWVNDALVVALTDSVNVLSNGRIGLYNEDAHVRFVDVCVISSAQ